MHEDHYAYQQRAERLRDYAPQISHSAALMQARFEAHHIRPFPKTPEPAEPANKQQPLPLPAPGGNPSSSNL